MSVKIEIGDILNFKADVLICSANPNLNLSGGVGGAFMARYGEDMQVYLHDYLKSTSQKIMERGKYVLAPPFKSPYQKVIHAVGVNGFYESNVEVMTKLLHDIHEKIVSLGFKSVVMPTIATGYGNLTKQDFYKAFKASSFAHSILEVTLCVYNEESYQELLEGE